MLEFITYTAEETQVMAEKIGRKIPAGTVLALQGELGVGKTTFAQGLARGLGVQERVLSPTFVIFQQYEGRLPFYHIDAYRLEKEDIYSIGLEECFNRRSVTLVEWADRIKQILPAGTLFLRISCDYNNGGELRRWQFADLPEEYPWLKEALVCGS